MKKNIKLIMTIALLLVMTVSLVGCGGETTPTSPSVSLVDITSDQGISMKLPSDLTKQENGSYANMETGDSVTFGLADNEGIQLSEWTEENVLATYSSKYEDVVVTSFENGKIINGAEALQSTVTLTTTKGNALTITLVIVNDDTTSYIVSFAYGTDNTDGALYQNLQTCIDSITIQ